MGGDRGVVPAAARCSTSSTTASTLSVTPVLADQLAAPGAADRLRAFLVDLRARDARARPRGGAGRRCARRSSTAPRAYARRRAAPGRARRRPRRGAHGAARPWTSRGHARGAAAVRDRRRGPAAAADAGSPRTASARRRRGAAASGCPSARTRRGWTGCSSRPASTPPASTSPTSSARATPGTCGRCARRPARCSCRSTAPWSSSSGADRGYPAHPAYRDYHALTERHHRAWANDGAPYDPGRAAAQVAADAADFVARVAARVRGGGLCVCALDTELLGHWWFEGPAWLGAVLAEADRAGLAVRALDDAVADATPADLPPGAGRVTTWGTPRTLWTWSGPQVADLAVGAREAELRVVAAGAAAGDRALRELLALQSSDWAFLATDGDGRPVPARARRRAPRGARPGAGRRRGRRPRAVARAAPGARGPAGALRTFRPRDR